MLRTQVKAGSITNLTDARYFAAWEARWLGFCLDPNDPSYVEPAMVQAIREWVDGPLIVGEFGLQDATAIQALSSELQLDAIQLSPFADDNLREALNDHFLIQEVVVARDTSWESLRDELDNLSGQVGLIALNFDFGGHSWEDLLADRPFAIDQLQELCESYPILLGLTWSASNLAEVLDTLEIQGMSVRGGEEEKVGFKSFDELDDLFELMEVFE